MTKQKAWKVRVVLILGMVLLAAISLCIWGCTAKETNEDFFKDSMFADMNEIFEEWCAADPCNVIRWELVVDLKEE